MGGSKTSKSKTATPHSKPADNSDVQPQDKPSLAQRENKPTIAVKKSGFNYNDVNKKVLGWFDEGNMTP